MNNHVFLNKSETQKLRGMILCHIVFLDGRGIWNDDQKLVFLKTLDGILDFLKTEAAKEGVWLRFEKKLENLSCGAGEIPFDIEYVHVKANGYDYPSRFEAVRKSLYGADGIITVYVQHDPIWREYARGSFCVVCRKSLAHSILHEMLHCFGAVDFYYPNRFKSVAEFTFPNSIMLCQNFVISSSSIDPLTKYLIGWHLEPNAAACSFLEQTVDVDEPAIRTALRISKNDLDEYYRHFCKPFASMAALEKAAMAKEPFACFLMGLVDKEHAIRLFKQAFNGDISAAGYQLAVSRLLRGDRGAKQVLSLIKNHIGAQALYAALLFEDRDDAWKAVVISNYRRRNRTEIGEGMSFRSLSQVDQECKILLKLSEMLPELHEYVKILSDEYKKIEKSGHPVLTFLMGYLLSEEGYGNPNMAEGLFEIAADQRLSAAASAIAKREKLFLAEYWMGKAAEFRCAEDANPERLEVHILNRALEKRRERKNGTYL